MATAMAAICKQVNQNFITTCFLSYEIKNLHISVGKLRLVYKRVFLLRADSDIAPCFIY